MRAEPGRALATGMRLIGLAGCIVLGLPNLARAERNEPLSRFWVQEQVARPPQARRHIVRPPSVIGARRPGFTTERRPVPDAAPASAAPAKVAAEATFVVGVFGDVFGAAVARGLSGSAAAALDRAVVDQTGDDGELTRSGLDVWRAAEEAAASKYGRIDAAVIMLGADETGLLVKPDEAGDSADPGGWRKLYGDQVEQLAAAFRDKRIPLIWVGLPPVRDDEEARHFLALNAIIRDRAVKGGAVYVDSWEAFTDDNGEYTATGPDVDGQPAKLRRSDGRTFTHAGARKLASFLESDLKRARDGIEAAKRLAAVSISDQSIFDQALQIDVNAQIRREAGLSPLAESAAGPSLLQTEGPVIRLTAAPLAEGGRLATLYDAESRLTGPAAATLDKGLSPPSHPGRADDFSWPKP